MISTLEESHWVLLIPDPLGSNTSGVLDGFRLILMDLGSVINDCGDKHYNTGDASGYLYVMQMGRHDHPRSIVTDHYLLDTSYGYIVKPVAMAIKTKHAGFNLVSC